MKNKTLAIVAYITLIGWVIAYFQYKNNNEKSSLVRYHLAQALGIFIFSIALMIVLGIIASVIPTLGTILSIAGLLPLILLILGIISASNEVMSPVPGIGKLFENKFSFLN
ncbi:hypothetical protein SAMN05518672_110135 [Chitinophaga sp. CF118]|uniref:import component protein n=1 Tax=Chitinophaga sp. CF118 TaxID=1884367 RepID=UPI0008EB4E0F|nr:import component protein [Chitinophaga sp. CF118]SFE80128.1 hypothetical protein SAMN05518672_110135 [Chitinophaga sp. CF118]